MSVYDDIWDNYAMDCASQCMSCGVLCREFKVIQVWQQTIARIEIHRWNPVYFGWFRNGRRTELYAFCSLVCQRDNKEIKDEDDKFMEPSGMGGMPRLLPDTVVDIEFIHAHDYHK